MKAMTLKLENNQIKLLEEVSRATQIPKSALVRKGIDLILQQAKEDILSLELRQEIDALLNEDQELLKKLAKS
jgi:hypothetical protein